MGNQKIDPNTLWSIGLAIQKWRDLKKLDLQHMNMEAGLIGLLFRRWLEAEYQTSEASTSLHSASLKAADAPSNDLVWKYPFGWSLMRHTKFDPTNVD